VETRKLTSQEVFDKVVEGLRKQGRRSFDTELGNCRYRIFEKSGEVLKCAAGMLIDDECYHGSIESKGVPSQENAVRSCVGLALMRSGVDESDMPLVGDLQHMHDNFDVREWEKQFLLIASRFGLNWSAGRADGFN